MKRAQALACEWTSDAGRYVPAYEARVKELEDALRSIVIITDGPTPHSPYTIAVSVNQRARLALGDSNDKG